MITIRWVNPNTEITIDSIKIYRSESPMDAENLPSALATLSSSAIVYDDETAVDDTLYYYRVQFVAGEQTAVSAEEAVIAPSANTDLPLTPPTVTAESLYLYDDTGQHIYSKEGDKVLNEWASVRKFLSALVLWEEKQDVWDTEFVQIINEDINSTGAEFRSGANHGDWLTWEGVCQLMLVASMSDVASAITRVLGQELRTKYGVGETAERAIGYWMSTTAIRAGARNVITFTNTSTTGGAPDDEVVETNMLISAHQLARCFEFVLRDPKIRSTLQLETISVPIIRGGSPVTLSETPTFSIDAGYTYNVFTSSGTFDVPKGITEVDVLIVAGGGGGGSRQGGGGGGGGVVVLSGYSVTPEDSISVVVGAGGEGGVAAEGGNGNDSSFDGQTATGGGGGGGRNGTDEGAAGGSGGGSSTATANEVLGGEGIEGQGHDGGSGNVLGGQVASGGGGGASEVGENGSIGQGGAGGDGVSLESLGFGDAIESGAPEAVGGGGGGGVASGNHGLGGLGGGGAGGNTNGPIAPTAGGVNTGGGGGGEGGTSDNPGTGANGGSGLVVVKFISTSGSPLNDLGSPIVTLDHSTVDTLRANEDSEGNLIGHTLEGYIAGKTGDSTWGNQVFACEMPSGNVVYGSVYHSDPRVIRYHDIVRLLMAAENDFVHLRGSETTVDPHADSVELRIQGYGGSPLGGVGSPIGNGSPTLIVDTSQAERTITDTNVVPVFSSYMTGNALRFNGTDSFLIADGTLPDFGNGDFTVECFLRGLPNTGSSLQTIIGAWLTVSGGRSWILRFDNTDIEFLYSTDGSNNVSVTCSVTKDFLLNGAPSHVVVQRSGDELAVFFNGQRGLISDMTGVTIFQPSPGTTDLIIGARESSSSGYEHFLMADVDEVMITVGEARYEMDGFRPRYRPHRWDALYVGSP